jgi:transcriptional regulator with XRE-family HTH domain
MELMGETSGEFAQLLRTLRERACLTQEELAERSGLSIRAISDLERGRTAKPQRKSVSLLADALRIEGEGMERFRRIARRRVAGPVAQPRSQWPLTVAGPDDSGRSGLIEWMRQILVGDPAGPGVPGPRLVELVGGTGAGKSSFAIQAAARFLPYFPDGQFYLDANGRGPAELAERLAEVFGPAADDGTGLDAGAAGCPDHRLRQLRRTLFTRRALLVIDNVVDRGQISPLLTAGGACAVIVIAQRRLALWEGVWTIDISAADTDLANTDLAKTDVADTDLAGSLKVASLTG